jgi:hypothetical protein
VPAAGAEARFPPGVSPRLSHPTACGHHLAYTHRRRCQDTNVLRPPCYHSQRAAGIVGFAADRRPEKPVAGNRNYTPAGGRVAIARLVQCKETGRTNLTQ